MVPIQVAPTQSLKLSTEAKSTQIIVHCSGRLVTETCEQFKQTVGGLISTTQRLVVDLGDVTRIDSSALGTIVGLYLSSKRAGSQLKLIDAKPTVTELLSRWPEDAFETQPACRTKRFQPRIFASACDERGKTKSKKEGKL